jgi:hypothetical protein
MKLALVLLCGAVCSCSNLSTEDVEMVNKYFKAARSAETVWVDFTSGK